MKKIVMIFAACLTFVYASAQLEPKTTQIRSSDTASGPITSQSADRTNIANKDIRKRNTIESGIGKPDNIKRKIRTARTITSDTIGKRRK